MKKIILIVSVFITNIGTSQYISPKNNLITELSSYNDSAGIQIGNLHPVIYADKIATLYPLQNYMIQYWSKEKAPYQLEENINDILKNIGNTDELYKFLISSNYIIGVFYPGNSDKKPDVISNWYYKILGDNIVLIVPSNNNGQWIKNLFPEF